MISHYGYYLLWKRETLNFILKRRQYLHKYIKIFSKPTTSILNPNLETHSERRSPALHKLCPSRNRQLPPSFSWSELLVTRVEGGTTHLLKWFSSRPFWPSAKDGWRRSLRRVTLVSTSNFIHDVAGSSSV